MNWHTWWVFAVTVFLLSGTPGPNMLHVLSRAVSLGFARSIPAMIGCLVAVVAVLSISAAGLGALLAASPRAFEALRYLGVAYLFWLGYKAWRGSAQSPQNAPVSSPAVSSWRVFINGLIVGFGNPKLLLFAAAFLPQFIVPSQPQMTQLIILVMTFAACEMSWYMAYALGGTQLRRYLTRPAMRRAFDRFTGVLFAGFGVLLLRFRPQ
ncbi:LysE family translocator [Pseudomonas syringae]|uniref:LysE family translocator n=1 Tax=Pseudomonas syringae pv. atrofaciens TaxID=192087 RepID=A0A0P9IAJ9_PSESX|nr:LysE family translocator [Pseudomonas syringae]AVX22995.1 LysE family translocator [Pseudomonas syringae pv. atrofaciens]ELS42869.1 Homoserine/lysine/threonine efflux protein, LysE/YggA family [Pseudomonas syringae pv. syringae B64]KPW06063.1 LysE/YggA family translocator protein [Pseudomonas syringae pv. atrofaciens]KZL39006.1 lysine exporter protein LysE/YggA [Pseudomonas syringae pv. syringae]MBI6815646.1 LysE family translocator [Pseudomonas syringae]